MRLLTQFKIRSKSSGIVPFIPTPIQQYYINNRGQKNFVLKARQVGITTAIELLTFEDVLLKLNLSATTIAHNKGKIQSMFKIVKFAWDNLPEEFKNAYSVKYDNKNELDFSNTGSSYSIALDTRSTTIHRLHVSELAFIKDIPSLLASSENSVPIDGRIDFETTANGLNGAYDFWNECKTMGFKRFFFNWIWEKGYSLTPPADNKWKEDYKIKAKQYNLIIDLQDRFQISDEKFFWYYMKALMQKEQMKQEYPTIPEESFLSSAVSVFDLFAVSQLKARPHLRTIQGVKIFYEPIAGHSYMIGIDTAEGVDSDSTSIEVLDVTDHSNIIEVASFLDSSIRPDQTAKLAIELGIMYNNAFIIPERNSSGLSTVLKIQEIGYENLFENVTIDKTTHEEKHEYGWRTMRMNRDVMINDLVETFEEGHIEINSEHVIQQMKTFVRKNGGRREHDSGYHDDALFGLFLSIQGMKYYKKPFIPSTVMPIY